MSMLPWIYSSAGLSATVSTKSESHWIASGMASKRRRTVILNSFSAKFTTPNAAAMLKQVLLLIVIASIGVQAKIQQWEAAEDKWQSYRSPEH
jgi:hypothetical protein